MAKWRRHSVEFKREVMERMKTCENIGTLARELELERKLLDTWKYQLEGRPEARHANLATTAEERKDKHFRQEIAKLKSALADRTLELDFFRSALLKVKEKRQKSTATGAPASTTPSSRGRTSEANLGWNGCANWPASAAPATTGLGKKPSRMKQRQRSEPPSTK